MYVTFCAARGTCLNLKNQWNRGGPCSSAFKGMCVDYFCNELELGCVNKGSLLSSGATPPGSCSVSGRARGGGVRGATRGNARGAKTGGGGGRHMGVGIASAKKAIVIS
jgi:hypothetical protein